ncbi:MAG TPA: hypothetical protein PKK23_04830 [Nitrospirales bacterium]|nr:hypothetical protein [Nitrospirales bacterium]
MARGKCFPGTLVWLWTMDPRKFIFHSVNCFAKNPFQEQWDTVVTLEKK